MAEEIKPAALTYRAFVGCVTVKVPIDLRDIPLPE
jgi:hypothetical protein